MGSSPLPGSSAIARVSASKKPDRAAEFGAHQGALFGARGQHVRTADHEPRKTWAGRGSASLQGIEASAAGCSANSWPGLHTAAAFTSARRPLGRPTWTRVWSGGSANCERASPATCAAPPLLVEQPVRHHELRLQPLVLVVRETARGALDVPSELVDRKSVIPIRHLVTAHLRAVDRDLACAAAVGRREARALHEHATASARRVENDAPGTARTSRRSTARP